MLEFKGTKEAAKVDMAIAETGEYALKIRGFVDKKGTSKLGVFDSRYTMPIYVLGKNKRVYISSTKRVITPREQYVDDTLYVEVVAYPFSNAGASNAADTLEEESKTVPMTFSIAVKKKSKYFWFTLNNILKAAMIHSDQLRSVPFRIYASNPREIKTTGQMTCDVGFSFFTGKGNETDIKGYYEKLHEDEQPADTVSTDNLTGVQSSISEVAYSNGCPSMYFKKPLLDKTAKAEVITLLRDKHICEVFFGSKEVQVGDTIIPAVPKSLLDEYYYDATGAKVSSVGEFLDSDKIALYEKAFLNDRFKDTSNVPATAPDAITNEDAAMPSDSSKVVAQGGLELKETPVADTGTTEANPMDTPDPSTTIEEIEDTPF